MGLFSLAKWSGSPFWNNLLRRLWCRLVKVCPSSSRLRLGDSLTNLKVIQTRKLLFNRCVSSLSRQYERSDSVSTRPRTFPAGQARNSAQRGKKAWVVHSQPPPKEEIFRRHLFHSGYLRYTKKLPPCKYLAISSTVCMRQYLRLTGAKLAPSASSNHCKDKKKYIYISFC